MNLFRKTAVFTLCLSALLSSAAYAVPSISVKDIFEVCEQAGADKPANMQGPARAVCMSYLDAVVATVVQISVLASQDGKKQGKPLFCVPPSVNEEQLTKVFLTFARKNPRHMNVAAAGIVSAAFADAYPCPK